MNEVNDRLLTELVRNVFDGKLKIVFDKWARWLRFVFKSCVGTKKAAKLRCEFVELFFCGKVL